MYLCLTQEGFEWVYAVDSATQPFLNFSVFRLQVHITGTSSQIVPWRGVALAPEANRPVAMSSAPSTSPCSSYLFTLGRTKEAFLFLFFFIPLNFVLTFLLVSLTSKIPSKTTLEINTQ